MAVTRTREQEKVFWGWGGIGTLDTVIDIALSLAQGILLTET